MTSTNRRRVHVYVSGLVQGVWFRGSTQTAADSVGLSGWVRNLPDGRVEFVAEGATDAVAKLLEWAHDGPPGARVDHVEVREEAPEGERGAFRFRR